MKKILFTILIIFPINFFAQNLGKSYDKILSSLNENSNIQDIKLGGKVDVMIYTITCNDKTSMGTGIVYGFNKDKICTHVCTIYPLSERDNVINDFNQNYVLVSGNHWKNCGGNICHYYTTDLVDDKFIVYMTLNSYL